MNQGTFEQNRLTYEWEYFGSCGHKCEPEEIDEATGLCPNCVLTPGQVSNLLKIGLEPPQ